MILKKRKRSIYFIGVCICLFFIMGCTNQKKVENSNLGETGNSITESPSVTVPLITVTSTPVPATPTPIPATPTPEIKNTRKMPEESLCEAYGMWRDSNGKWTMEISSPGLWESIKAPYFELKTEVHYIKGYLHEDYRASESSFYMKCEDYWRDKVEIKLTFAEDGIYVEDVGRAYFDKLYLTREGLYENIPTGSTGVCYTNYSDYQILQQYDDRGNTYLVLLDTANYEDLWMVYFDGIVDESLVGGYFTSETIYQYPNVYIKGYPFCVLENYTYWTNDEYWSRESGYGDEPSDEYVEEPEFNFPHTYDVYWYQEDLGIWFVANIGTNRKPFAWTDIELLDWVADKFMFIGKIQNLDSEEHRISLKIKFCDADGDTLKSYYSQAWYYPEGYVINKDKASWLLEPSSDSRTAEAQLEIPAGEKGVFAFGVYEQEAIGWVHDITEPICYVYIVLESYY